MGDESVDEYHDIVSRTFAREDDGFEFYNSYALAKGFSVRKSYVEWDDDNQEIILRKLVCSREGSEGFKLHHLSVSSIVISYAIEENFFHVNLSLSAHHMRYRRIFHDSYYLLCKHCGFRSNISATYNMSSHPGYAPSFECYTWRKGFDFQV
jgi:zinc finger SWIM domain-containing protein 3